MRMSLITAPWRANFVTYYHFFLLQLFPRCETMLASNEEALAMTTLQIFIMLGLASPALIFIAWAIWDQRPSARKW